MMRLLLALCLLLGLAFAADTQYTRGPKGGCYTITKSGRKRYVDRSMCDPPGKSAPPAVGKYIRGPRGGCYTVTASGTKRYVDRALCANP